MPVPWAHLIRFAPELISISRELLQRTRGKPAETEPVRVTDPGELAARIAALEENERRQAELVERMAEQQADLARAVLELHTRERWLIGAVVGLAAAFVALLAWVLLR